MRNLFKLILTLSVMLWVSDAFSQTEAGTVYFSGSTNVLAAFGTTTEKFEPKDGDDVEYDGPKFTAFNVGPRIGYFLINGLVAGVFLDYNYIKEEQDANDYASEYTATWNSMVFGPFAKIYIGDGNVKPFAVGSVGFGSSKSTYEAPDMAKSSDDEMEYKLFNWSVGAGLAIFASESVSFEFGVAYGSDKTTNEGEYGDSHEIENAFGVRIGIGVFLGD